MEPYKPQYLGKIMPATTPDLTTFMQKKYEQFSKTFDVCKSESTNITTITNVSSPNDDALVVKVSTGNDTLSQLTESVNSSNDETVTISGNEIKVDPV